MKRTMTYAFLLLTITCTAFAETGFETAEVHIGYHGRKEEVRTVACQRQSDGAWRFHMPTRDIPRDAWYVDVFADVALEPGRDYTVAYTNNAPRAGRAQSRQAYRERRTKARARRRTSA